MTTKVTTKVMATRAERFDLAQIAAQPWKNGAGLTREIAVHPIGAGIGDFEWRVSLAEVVRDAPFSAFPGVDRCITLLRGAGMRLTSASPSPSASASPSPSPDGRFDERLDRPLQPLHFPGDLPLQATLIDGPCSDFNVMTRRGAIRGEVTCHHAAAELPGGGTRLLLCCDGEAWQVGTERLAALQGVLWRVDAPGVSIRPFGVGALLHIRLCQDPPR